MPIPVSWIKSFLSVYVSSSSQSVHTHRYTYIKPPEYVKVVCEGGYETFFIWPLIPKGLSCHTIAPLWPRTENKCLFLPHLWELSFPEQNAVIIPDLPSARRTRASDTVWKVKCVCVWERLWKSEISDWGWNDPLWTEAGLWWHSSLGCAGIQVGASEEGRRANRRLLNEQYINYLKRHRFHLYDVWRELSSTVCEQRQDKVARFVFTTKSSSISLSGCSLIQLCEWSLNSYNYMRPGCSWHGNPF